MSLSSRARAIHKTGMLSYQQALMWLNDNGLVILQISKDRNVNLKAATLVAWESHLKDLRERRRVYT